MADNHQYFVVDKIKAGDTEAFRGLFRMYYPSVLAFVEGFVKDRGIAEDIVQDVFVKLWIYRASLDATRPIRGYLFLLSRREVCSWFRKEVTVQKLISGLAGDELYQLQDTPEKDASEMEELRKTAERIVEAMPEKRRHVFILSRREGLKIQEIADRLGISPRTVNKHIQLALRTLRLNMNKI